MCPGSQIIQVNCLVKEAATHLPILYADRGEFDRKRFSPPIADADTPGDFFRRLRRCWTSTLFAGSIEERFEK